MRDRPWHDYNEKLWQRVNAIEERRAAGHSIPTVWKLAMRRDPGGQRELSRLLTDYKPNEIARERLLAERWARRTLAGPSPIIHYNFAIDRRNRSDMAGYRYWLARDPDLSSRDELKAFKIRFPHTIMKRWRRFARER